MHDKSLLAPDLRSASGSEALRQSGSTDVGRVRRSYFLIAVAKGVRSIITRPREPRGVWSIPNPGPVNHPE